MEARTEHEIRIEDALRRAIGTSPAERDKTFYEHGGDSLGFVRFVLALSDHYDDSALERASPDIPLRELGRILGDSPARAAQPAARSGFTVGPVQVTANRHSFIGRIPGKFPNWISVSQLYSVASPYDRSFAQSSVRHLLEQLDGLRLELDLVGGKWRQELRAAPDAFVEAEQPDEPVLSDGFILAEVRKAAAAIRPQSSPIKILFFSSRDRQSFSYVFVVHHALIDARSKAIAEPFLASTYLALQRGEAPPAPSRLSYQSFCEGYLEDAERRTTDGLDYWRQFPWYALPANPQLRPPVGGPTSQVVEDFAIGNYEAVARRFAGRAGVPLSHACLAAIARAYGDWTGEEWLSLALVMNGRGPVPGRPDPTGTVGWISELVPFLIPTTLPPGETVALASERVKQLDSLGRTYGYLRYLTPDMEIRREFSNHPDPAISLNLLLGAKPDPGSQEFTQRDFGWDHQWTGELVYPVSGGLTNSASGIRLSWETDGTRYTLADLRQFSGRCALAFRALFEL